MTLDEILFKIFGWLIGIDQVILFLLFLGTTLYFTRFWKWGRRASVTAVALLFITTIMPTGFWLMTWLENRFPPQTTIPAVAKGLILLGGSYNFHITIDRDRRSYTLAAGRLIDFVELAHKYSHLPILFTGGGIHPNPRANESANAKETLADLGLDINRVTFETESKTTIENAANSYKLVKPQAGEKWILVTSAYHMPRAVGLFEGAGWEVIPYPVDYHTVRSYPWYFINTNIALGMMAWSNGIREIAGLVRNYLTGRSKELFPSA